MSRLSLQRRRPQRTSLTHNVLEENVKEAIVNLQNGKNEYMVNGIKGPFWFMFWNISIQLKGL